MPVSSALGNGVISTTTPEIEGCCHFDFFGSGGGGQVVAGCAEWVRKCKDDAGHRLAEERLRILKSKVPPHGIKLNSKSE